MAAVAVYGSVAIEGARHDLVRGLDANFGQFLGTADLWVTTGGDDLTTNAFAAGTVPERLVRRPEIADVRLYQGSLLDDGNRRLWIIARSARDRHDDPAEPARERRSRHGLGEDPPRADGPPSRTSLRRAAACTSATPSRCRRPPARTACALPRSPRTSAGRRVRVILNATDYRREWQTNDPSALQIDLAPGVSPRPANAPSNGSSVRRPACTMQTQAERRAQYASLSRQGLTSLSQISIMLLVSAAIAVAAALAATIWQRRPRLAALRIRLRRRPALARAADRGRDRAEHRLRDRRRARAVRTRPGEPLPRGDHRLPGTFLDRRGLARAHLLTRRRDRARDHLLPGWAAATVPARTSFQE